jgi:uncharacterized membrane protein YkvA (DUF1232 family)
MGTVGPRCPLERSEGGHGLGERLLAIERVSVVVQLEGDERIGIRDVAAEVNAEHARQRPAGLDDRDERGDRVVPSTGIATKRESDDQHGRSSSARAIATVTSMTAHDTNPAAEPAATPVAEPGDRHPAARLAETLSRLPNYLRLTRALLADRRLGRVRKAGLGAALAYLASPIDLVPGIVPVLGQVDDLLVMFMAVRYALKGMPGPAADALLARSGLSRALLVRDVSNTRAAGAWAARSAGRISGRIAITGARAATRVAGVGLRAARSGLRRLRRRRG